MHSVGRSSEPGDPVRGSVAQAEPVVAAPQVSNRALAQMAAGAQPPVAPIAVARPASASLSLDDPSFNPTTRAHDLLRAIDSEQYTFAMKGSDTPFGGMTEDVAAERRKIDFPAAVAALDGLTASQVKRVEEVFFEFEKKTTLQEDLFGGGQSGRKADLTPDQVARLQALLLGTKPEPIPADVLAELRSYPPEVAGPLKADLEKRADAEPALHRHQADAAELHTLLASDLDEAKRERLMAMHRRPAAEIDAVDALYEKEHGPASLTLDLNRRLDGLQRMRMTELRMGNFAQADACAIEDKRRQIEALNKQESDLSGLAGGLAVGYDVLGEQRRKQKQALTQDIQAILELNKREALADPANSGRSAGDAVADRLKAILGQQDGEVGNTLGSELARTLNKEDAAVLAAATDPWDSTGSSRLVRAAAAQLAADEKSHSTSAKKVIETLKSFRELAQHDLTAIAYDPRVPPEQKQEMLRGGEGAVTRLAQKYVEEYEAEYNRLAGEDGRTYEEIVKSADDADARYIGDLSFGGGRTSDLGELDHAMGKKDVDAVKALLRRQPNREKVDELVAAYNQLGEGHDLRKELFGTDYSGRTATPELAQIGNKMLVGGGLVTGRDAAQVAEQLSKPTAAEMKGDADAHDAEARWIAGSGLTEYQVTMDHRGVTGRLREIGDDPETERLLERTRNDLAVLMKQFDMEKDPARRERLVAEMRRLRATLTGDADAYEKDNERVLGEIRSALSFAVSIALAVVIPGAGAGLVAFLQTTALNIAANVAANVVIKGDDYSWADLKADVLGGALGAGGAKFGEELMGRVASAVMRPAAEATAETASKLGVQTALAHEVGAIAGAGEKTVIAVEEFEVRAASGQIAARITETSTRGLVVTGAREVGGFFGGIYAPKIMTGDFGLSVEEVLKALAATAAGKAAHRKKPGTAEEETAAPKEEDTAAPKDEETAPKHDEDVALPVSGPIETPPPPPPADVFGPRAPHEMLLDNGIPPNSAQGFQAVADIYNVILKVRPTNTASLPVLERGGVAKPELIKAKTVNRVDQLLGAPPDGLGKVGFFEPKMPSRQILEALTQDARQAVQDRFTQRSEEYAHYKDEYGKLAAEGLLRMKDGVIQIADPRSGEFRDIGGDHDLFEITNSDGTPLHNDVRRALVSQLRGMGINVEHPDHVSWAVDSPQTHDPAADQKIRAQHETTEPLVAFVPKSQPRQVMAGDVVTGPARREGPGDRFLPASSGHVTEPGPAGPTRPGETDFSVEPAHATAAEIAAAREREPLPYRPAGAAQHGGPPPTELSTRIAGRLLEVRGRWLEISPQKRAEELVHAVAKELTLTGCPAPKVLLVEGSNSQFLPDVWLIRLATPAVELNNPTTEQFAEICDHVRHEWEHAVLEFRVARRENQQTGADIDTLAGRLHIDRGAAEMAIKANAAGGYFEAVDAAPLDAQTAAIRESLHGAGQLDRNLILDRLRAAETALATARANADPAGQAAIADALLEYNAAHADYMTLPDEIAAWDVGRQVAEVVRLHHELATRIVTARRQLGQAETALDRGGGRALERLESAVTRAQRRLNDLLDILADRTGRNP